MKMARHEALYILNHVRGNTDYVRSDHLLRLRSEADDWAKANYEGDKLAELLLSHEAAHAVILNTNID